MTSKKTGLIDITGDTGVFSANDGESENFAMARTEASYNTFYGCLSYISNMTDETVAYGNYDEYRGAASYSIFATGKDQYTQITTPIDASSYESSKKGSKYNGTINDSTFKALSLGIEMNGNTEIDSLYRNEDGSVNMHDMLALNDQALLTFCSGKAIGCTLDDLTGGYLSTQWTPDPHTACVENLTPKTFFVPTWVEAADDNGFAWNSNPVCIGGAGKYTIVVASYNATVDETKADSYNFAMGLVKTEEKEEFVPAAHDHYRLVGSINSWNKDDTAAGVQFSAEGVLSYTFAADDEFKVISALTDGTGTWDGAFGFSADSLGEGVAATDFEDNGGNFKVVTAGAYTLTVANGALKISK
jgi:hypothetical protein